MTDAKTESINQPAGGPTDGPPVGPDDAAGLRGHSVDRRVFLKGIGAAAVASAGLASAGVTPAAAFDWDDAAKMVAATAVAGPVGLGWALRDVGFLADDSPPEGLTADGLEQKSYETALTRKSSNESTFVDNRNILSGLENTAYTKGKTAAIEEINNGSSQAVVEDAATAAVDSHATTVLTNLLKSWNESVREFANMDSLLHDHPDTDPPEVFNPDHTYTEYGDSQYLPPRFGTSTTTYTLPDGADFELQQMESTGEVNNAPNTSGGAEATAVWSAVDQQADSDTQNDLSIDSQPYIDARGEQWLDPDAWNPLVSDIETTMGDVRDGILLWVDNVYSEVQSGEIDLSELITPGHRAEMMAEEESQALAIADLAALNIPVDVERQATVTIEETGATVRGSLAVTDESDGPFESGTTYDPSTLNGDVYLTFDTSLLKGDWSAYETGVDGGNMTLSEEPYPGTIYEVETTANESVHVNSTEWTSTGNGTWYYDAQSDLETSITEIASVDYFSASEEANYETIMLSSSFTIEKFENTETGEEAQQASFSSSEPQSDDNYITQEEWDQLEQQNQELIEKYEESQQSGGGGLFDLGLGQKGVIALVLAMAAALAGAIGS